MYWLTGVLGIVLTFSPFVFGYSENTFALWTSVILGGTSIVMSVFEGATGGKGRWEYWVVTIAGFAAIAAPFVLGFGAIQAAMLTSVAVGLLLSYVAGSALYYDRPKFR